MKKLLILLAIALIAAPAFADPLIVEAPTPMSLAVPVQMLIDKTVTLSVDPPVIMLYAQNVPVPPGTGDFQGVTVVSMTHNFPVTVTAVIAPVGPSLGPLAVYLCGLSDVSIPLPFPGPLSNVLTYNTPAPAPGGRMFFLGAEVMGANIDFIPSSSDPQQVAMVILTVTDII